MGVPSFYRWLVNKYPKIVVNIVGDMEFDNLYLDMNGIIHPCFHPDSYNIVFPTTFEDVFNNVYKYIDQLFDIVNPRKLLFLAIDGVAPRAKMNQQRSRRFRNAKDNETFEKMEEMLRKKFETEGKKVLPKEQSELADSNIITPGTEFMCSLSEKLQTYIKLRMNTDPRWKTIKVILSNANVPGEGEHKIMAFIRAQRCCEDYDVNTKHCLYGMDADLIMLALATHEAHFFILREDVLKQENIVNCVSELQRVCHQAEANKQKSRERFNQEVASDDKKLDKRVPPVKKIPFQYLDVWLLREYLRIDISITNLPEKFAEKVDPERIIDDFVFMCFFAGNDFLPHMPTLQIQEGAIDLLIHVYKNEFKNLGGYLIDAQRIEDKKAGYIKLNRVEKFMVSVGEYEDKIFEKRIEIRERNIRLMINAENAQVQERFDAMFERDTRYSDPSSSSETNKTLSSGIFQETADVSDVLENTRELMELLKEHIRYKSDTFRNGELGVDKVKLSTPGYKERYYDAKFLTKNQDERERKRKEVIQKYTEGLCWILGYYYAGVPSWNWFYPFHYGPFASDFKGISQVKIMFQKGLPFKPFDQLMAALPPKSVDALPGVYKKLMLETDSNIIDLYPTDFEVDLDGKRYFWQAVCKLPFIQGQRLLTETKIVENELKEHEKQRNADSADRLFLSSLSGLGEQIMSSIHKGSVISTSTWPSNEIKGFIRLELNGLTAFDLSDKSEDQDVLCVFYKLPCDRLHKPRLLDGVEFPEKTVTEKDIVQSVLWHENNGNSNRRPIIQMQKRSSERTEENEIIHKEAGIGWGGRRGKIGSTTSSVKMAIGNQQVSFGHSANRDFRQMSSTSSTRSDHNDWRREKEHRALPSGQPFRGWENVNASHSWTEGQPLPSFSIRQSLQQQTEVCKDGKPNQMRGQSYASSSTRQLSYGRGNYVPKAANWKWGVKEGDGGSFD